jgi:hypothetical protein
MNIEAKEVQPEHLEKEKIYFQNYLKALHNEEREWRQKSRAMWLKERDTNTSFHK